MSYGAAHVQVPARTESGTRPSSSARPTIAPSQPAAATAARSSASGCRLRRAPGAVPAHRRARAGRRRGRRACRRGRSRCRRAGRPLPRAAVDRFLDVERRRPLPAAHRDPAVADVDRDDERSPTPTRTARARRPRRMLQCRRPRARHPPRAAPGVGERPDAPGRLDGAGAAAAATPRDELGSHPAVRAPSRSTRWMSSAPPPRSSRTSATGSAARVSPAS